MWVWVRVQVWVWVCLCVCHMLDENFSTLLDLTLFSSSKIERMCLAQCKVSHPVLVHSQTP